MKLCSIASGSSGNCIFAGTESTSILIDTGLSGKRIEAGLNEIGHTAREAGGAVSRPLQALSTGGGRNPYYP